MQDKTEGLIDLILDEDKVLVDAIKIQLNRGNFDKVVESIFSISRNNEQGEMVCQKDDYFNCMTYFNDNYNILHNEILNALKEKCIL